MVMMRVIIFTVLLVLPQIIDCIQTTHHDGGAKISSRAISTTSRDAQNITDSSDRQRRLIPYMTFYLTRNYAQPQSTQYQLPPQKLQVQPVYQNKYVVSDYQPKYVVDTPLLSYRPKPSYTPFLDVNKIPGQFTPMLRNQPQSPQYQIQPTNDPNFSNIFDKLLQMKQNTKTIQYTPSPPPQYQTPKVITSQYYARRPTIKLIPVPNYGEQPQESYKPPEEYRTVQIIDNQNYKPTYVPDNYSYRPTENNHKYRLTSDNNSYRPVSVADNHSYRPSVVEDNRNYRPTVAADNHNYRPTVATDNHSYRPSVPEDNHNYRPTSVEENHNFRPTTVEENHSYRPLTIEDNHSYRPDDNQSYRPIGNFRPVINPENQGPKPILIVDEQSYKPIQPENQSYRPISLSDQARNQPIRLDIRPTIQTYSKPPPVQSENFKPSIQISNDQTYKTVYRPTTTPRPAPSHIKTIIHTYTPSSIEIPNRNEDYDGFESLKYRPKPPVKNVQIVPDDGYKQFVVIPQRASPDKNYDAYVLRPVQPSEVYRPVTTDRPELREPPVENPNSLSVILKQLQDSNTLPQTLTPDNIDNSIKTLVHILNSLKNTKLQRPIVVDEPDEDEEQEDEDEDVPTDISAISDYALNTPEGGTPGKAGHDYPAYSKIPQTTFDCKTQRYKGFFGDPDTNCQVWHYCDLNGGQASFLCPNGTIFSQVALTCDWWYNVKCATTTQLYVLNERLYKYILPFTPKFPEDYSGPLVDKYLALKFKEMEEKMRRQKKGKQKPKQDAPEGDVDKLQIIEAETVTKQLIPETDEVEQNDKEQQKK